ncbi:uncharacterized protein Eint_070802 [Encephalitozoon intestinalis ATCC 50506]|uniref:Uncharacterized protein n=1 Tax=Encephalitozoon intestinalis (strain ATCC 50506) TaxID=876142 RepID=W8PKI1_ENCIT|nr:uncharacterized protein Eint_070802 [Encephalitozoon intestinalis ATCC 50506]AHL30125.1 hypothetical protein Eint_070802 [Encephalitozoon intestinalis ATCC 50506]UTX45595.1 hypothetical protein GPK93_07g11590 [Encephalitozoon intestinalis]
MAELSEEKRRMYLEQIEELEKTLEKEKDSLRKTIESQDSKQ